MTTLIGRVREIRAVRALLANNRLVTLTGPGGCGKSRLGVAVASHPDAGRFVWIPLAATDDEQLVADRIAEGIGLGNRPRQAARDALRDALRDAELTIVLDNCEHLTNGCADAAELVLADCPGVRLLATSREPLGVAGERRLPVRPLSVPDPRNPPPVTSLTRYESVRLLVDRATAVEPSFTVTADNAAAVAWVCARLDGMPLAIELAAAGVRALTIEEISTRLRSSFDVLTASGRTALPQQRTIRATIEWSVRLLSPPERALLCRLAVCAGGFTLDTAESVGGDPAARRGGVLEVLARLVDRSLVMVDQDSGVSRYHLLETVRQYGIEQLGHREFVAARARHAEHFVRLVTANAPAIKSGDRKVALRRLDSDHDNLRAALSFTAELPLPADHLRLAAGMMFFWFMRGHLREGRRWLAAAVERASVGAADPTLLADVLSGAGLLSWTAGDSDAAKAHLERAIDLYRASADARGLSQALRFLSGDCETRGELARARALVEESVAFARRDGGHFDLAMALGRLGVTAVSQHEFDAAFDALDESLTISREAGDGWAAALTLRHIGIAGLRSGHCDRAAAALRESLHLLRATDDRFLNVQSLETMGAVRAAQGDLRTAVLLLGALAAQRESVGVTIIYSADLERAEATCRSGLPDEEFSRLWTQGSALTTDQLYDLALGPSGEVDGAAPDPAADGAPAGPADGLVLTPRESQILRLVARGMTNDQAARALFVSPRTVNWHLTAIYAKLGLRSRTEATRYALDHGLR